MPLDMLIAQAVEIRADYASTVRDPVHRRDWLESGKLTGIVDTLTNLNRKANQHSNASPKQDIDWRLLREELRVALKDINQTTDNGFWYLNASVSVKTWSAIVLFGLFVSMVVLAYRLHPKVSWSKGLGACCENYDLSLLATVMSGVSGASVSTLLANEPPVMSIGATMRHYLYYVPAKPVVGAFAAVLVDEQIRPRLDHMATEVFTNGSSPMTRPRGPGASTSTAHSYRDCRAKLCSETPSAYA